jgi:putative membrane protein
MMITENRQEVFYMLREGMNGFCMALADSVPGVSGGTVAFILGFYDRFIGSINDFVFGNMEKKKTSFSYLVKLGIGWMTGMVLAVLLLSSLFESYIYTVSSLFMGFIAGSIPLIIREEKESFGGSRNILKGIGFCIAGILVVAGIAWLNGKTGVASMDLGQFHIGTGIRLFFIGMIAISAMFLPGISGSTLLLIFGAYIPVITAVRGLLGMDFSYLPLLIFFGLGVLTGAVTVVKGIQFCLEKFRTQSVYAILGMMIGSFYAIMQGPATLKVPQPVMGFGNFQILAALVGLALVLGMQLMKERR